MKAKAKVKAKVKEKAKKKRTVWVVALAQYNRNEHKDALSCILTGDVCDTHEAAHDAIMEHIRYEALDYLVENGLDMTVKECVRDGIVYNCWDCVKFELNGIEYFYTAESIEV